MTEVDLRNFEAEVLKSTGVVLVDFYGDQCPPCKVLAPTLEAFAAKGFKVVKVNFEDSPELTEHYKVETLPTILSFKDGNAIIRATGILSMADLHRLHDHTAKYEPKAA